ncbi:MAG: UDP-N-acetylmuramoyl-L-alanine--D-glutamate ligase [bacterium]|nr:UDP-N-acetylmuramoyl-L-alanine--D-glutamate ligase [bacterium]
MKIALIGFGLEAKSAYDFLRKKFEQAEFEIYDQNETSKVPLPEGVKFYGGFNNLAEIQADLIVRTPAVNPRKLPKNTKITSVTNLFFEQCTAPIIGVTGSKGKGTVSSFVAEILRASSTKTHLLGNIGTPALDVLPEILPSDAVIYELSSFQLWDLVRAPHIAILNNIEPDHLDVHDSFEDYVLAKMNIALKQTEDDFLIYNCQNSIIENYISKFEKQIASEKQTFPNFDLAHFEAGQFFWGDTPLFETNIVKLPGEHNLQNALAAMTATYDFLREKGFEEEEIFEFWREGLSKFEGLPHRLKFVREKNNVRFYDDSIATTPGSAIAAMDSFAQPKVLILGGSDKGADLTELISKITHAPENQIRKVILIGSEAEKLAEQFREHHFENFENLGLDTNMHEIVRAAFRSAQPGDVVVMSPAHASFDMFKSYVDRGEQFIEAVQEL